MPRIRLLLPLILLALLALGPPATALAVQVGIGDQKAASFADPRLRSLGLGEARLIVPWNAASTEPAAVDAWLAAVRAAGMTPHVAFEHLRSDRCPGRPCTLPSVAQYGAAVRRFVARFPQVTTYTTWNEANHESQPTAYHPETVAAYYDQLTAACPSCTIVAGDVLDSGAYAAWLRRYLAAGTTTPQLWGLHDYGDVTHDTTTGADTVLGIVPGQVWVEETGGIVSLRNAASRTTFTASESAAATAIDRAFAIAAARPRITRMYFYEWIAYAGDAFDAGLLRPDGTARPGYAALVRDLAAQTTSATPAAAAPALRWSAAWSARHARQVVLRGTCRATGRRCAGRVTVTLRTRRAGAATSAVAHVAARSYATTAAHPTRVLRLTVSRALWLRARGAATCALSLRVVPTRPAAGASTTRVRLARPARRTAVP